MKISEESMEEFGALTAPDAERGDCPGSHTLDALARGELADEERDRALDHVAGCSGCAQELKMAREIHGWVRDRESAGSDAGRMLSFPLRAAPSRIVATLVAAVLAVAVGLWWIVPGDGSDAPSTVRGSSPPSVVEGLLPADGGRLAEAPDRLRWPSQGAAEGYRVQVLDAAGAEVWTSPWLDAAEAEPSWPELAAGAYLWTVEVRGPVDRRRLGPYTFHLDRSHQAPAEP